MSCYAMLCLYVMHLMSFFTDHHMYILFLVLHLLYQSVAEGVTIANNNSFILLMQCY